MLKLSLVEDKVKNKTTTILEILFGLVFLILFVVSGILASENTKLQKEVIVLKSAPSPSIMPTVNPTATASPTSDWKTYTNPTYHISFQYPQDFVTPNIMDSGKMLTANFSSSDKNKQLIVWAADTRNDLHDEHGFNCVKSLLTNVTVTIGGHSGVMNANETDPSMPDCLYGGTPTIFDTYFVSVSDMPLDVQYGGPKIEVSITELNQILSSFQFTQ